MASTSLSIIRPLASPGLQISSPQLPRPNRLRVCCFSRGISTEKTLTYIESSGIIAFPRANSAEIAIEAACAALHGGISVPGYEGLCCLRCMQPRDHNFATTCVCHVPKHLREEKVIECVHCGCRGCASGD